MLFPPFSELQAIEYRELLTAVRTAVTNKQKGDTLEDLATFLFDHTACFESHGKQDTATGEIDILIERRGPPLIPWLDECSSTLVVECKNWSERIGPEHVDKLVAKAKKSGSNVGLLFARLGLTGNPGFDGLSEVRNHYALDRVAVLVIDESDLDAIGGGANFMVLLGGKYIDVKLLA